MQLIDLCSGIGGFSYAASQLGWKTTLFCEIEPFCQKVLRKNFPNVPIFNDLKELEKKDFITSGFNHAKQSILTAGIPCQPFSLAGNMLGTDDNRSLWGEAYRIIKIVKPTWVIIENVANFANMAFAACAADLESQGYEVQAFLIPACAVGAIHKRERIWIVANADGIAGRREWAVPGSREREAWDKFGGGFTEPTTNADSLRKPQPEGRISNERGWLNNESQKDDSNAAFIRPERRSEKQVFRSGDLSLQFVGGCSEFGIVADVTEPAFCGANDGLSKRLVRDRRKQLKAYGNSIVPQVAFQIMQTINKLCIETTN